MTTALLNVSHRNCNDGVLSSAIVYNYCQRKDIDKEFHHYPMNYGDDIEKLLKSIYRLQHIHQLVEVVFTDFSLPTNELKRVADLADSTLVLDHHASAQEALSELQGQYPYLHILFDMTKSGCEMTWNYYNDNTPTPNLIKWVGDRDLWKFQYPETKPITSVIREKGMDLEQWVKYLNEPELIGKLLTKGKVINDFTTNQHLIEANKLVKIWKEQGDIYKPIFTNLTYGISEILNNIVIHKDYPFKIAVSFRMQQNKALCSVRSVDDESAQHYAEVRKGGGHPNAAGFEMSLSELEPNIN